MDFVPKLRSKWLFCPLIVITSDPTDKALDEALRSGADDFVRKPINPAEIVSRVQRRIEDMAEKEATNLIKFGDLTVDKNHRLITGPEGQDNFLPPIEFNLLLCLLQSVDSPVSRQVLKRKGWGKVQVTDNAVDRKLYEIRKALEHVQSSISLDNEYGKGFVLRTKKQPNGFEKKSA